VLFKGRRQTWQKVNRDRMCRQRAGFQKCIKVGFKKGEKLKEEGESLFIKDKVKSFLLIQSVIKKVFQWSDDDCYNSRK
jgi:hypothetical protein